MFAFGINANACSVVNLALKKLQRERVEHFALDDALQWAGAVRRVVAEFDEEVLRGGRQLQLDVTLAKPADRRSTWIFTISPRSSRESTSKMIVSSMRFRNSGRNV